MSRIIKRPRLSSGDNQSTNEPNNANGRNQNERNEGGEMVPMEQGINVSEIQ